MAETIKPVTKRLNIMRITTAVTIVILLTFAAVTFFHDEANVYVQGGDVYHFGTVASNTAVEHVFLLRNPHPFSLGISVSLLGCACTEARLSSDHMSPFGVVAVKVKISPDTVGEQSEGICLAISRGHAQRSVWLILEGRLSNSKKVLTK
jgi:hypothetical protein